MKNLFFFIIFLSHLLSADLIGNVSDKNSKEPLIGANVYIKNTNFGAATDLDGNFIIKNIPTGDYLVIVSFISYKTIEKSINIIEKNEIFNFELEINSLQTSEINVSGVLKKSNEIKKIFDQKQSKNIINTFSESELRKSGDSNAAEALRRITGVTIVEDKNIVIRGLGDRYSQAQINGLTMPSTDPDKRNLPLNLFPSKIIEKIEVYKSYHPKLPGNFAGGSINVKTKSYPDNFILKFNITNSNNSNLSINNIRLPNNGYVNVYGDYSDYKLDLSKNEFGSKYIFEYRPVYFRQYHGTDLSEESYIFETFLNDLEYSNYEFIENNDWNIDDQIWEQFYYNKLAANVQNLKSSYQKNQINDENLKIFGIQLPRSPFGFSLMNGNKYEKLSKTEFGYFINLNYKNDFETNIENNKIHSKSGNSYNVQYDFDQNQNSFKTNLSILATTGIKYKFNKNHFFKIDYNYLDIITSKNEAMSTFSDESFYELDNGGLSLSDKITEKSIKSHHYIINHNFVNDKFSSELSFFYNNSKSNLNMPDMKQQTYHKNIYQGNGVWDDDEIFVDSNLNGIWDEGDLFTDLGNGIRDDGESFTDLGNGVWDQQNGFEDFNDNGIPAFGWSGENNGIWDFADSNGNGICEEIIGLNPLLPNVSYWECETWTDIGNGVWDENEVFFDIGNGVWDEGEEIIYDFNNNGLYDAAEEYIDSNGDGIYNYAELFEDTNGNGIWDEGEELVNERIDYLNENYRYLSLIQGQGENGVKPTKRTWVYGGEKQTSFGLDYNFNFKVLNDINIDFLIGIESIEKDRSFSKREFTMGTNSSFNIFDGIFNPNINYPGEIFDDTDNLFSLQLETFTDNNGNGLWDSEELFNDLNNNGIWDGPEVFNDLNNNGIWDGPEVLVTDLGNGIWDEGEVFIDVNNDGHYNPSDEFIDLNGNEIWDGDYFVDINGNGEYDADDFLESASFLGNCDYDGDGYFDGPCDVNGDGIYNLMEELIIDWDNDGYWDIAESFTDLGNGIWDEGEEFNDINNNGIWDEDGEPVVDSNNNGQWDDAEIFDDINNNGIWDAGEDFIDIQDPELVNGLYDEGEKFTDLNNNGVWDQGEDFDDGYNGVYDNFIQQDGIYMMESSALASNNSYRAQENLMSRYFLLNTTFNELTHIDEINFGLGFRYEDYSLYMQPYNTVTGENLWRTISKNNVWDQTEIFEDNNMNNQYDPGENFQDINGDGAFNFGESFSDLNDNGIWDEGEPLNDRHPILLINANKKEKKLLPVVNFNLSPNKLMKVRLSYSKTIARPNYRELAPTKYEEFYSDRAIEGNPYLKTTDITNYDLRFEFYPSLASMYSIAFYKKTFENPISLVIRPGSSHNYISYSNSKNASVEGFEVEFMNKLKFIPVNLGSFSLGSNLSFINSESKSYDQFISYMGNVQSDISNSKDRPMMGQSDFIFNGSLGWSWKNFYELNLSYNYYTKRLIYVGAGESPDEYEYPQPDLNLTSKINFKDVSISFKVKNLFDSEYKLGSEYNDITYYTKKYRPGINYSISIGYGI